LHIRVYPEAVLKCGNYSRLQFLYYYTCNET